MATLVPFSAFLLISYELLEPNWSKRPLSRLRKLPQSQSESLSSADLRPACKTYVKACNCRELSSWGFLMELVAIETVINCSRNGCVKDVGARHRARSQPVTQRPFSQSHSRLHFYIAVTYFTHINNTSVCETSFWSFYSLEGCVWHTIESHSCIVIFVRPYSNSQHKTFCHVNNMSTYQIRGIKVGQISHPRMDFLWRKSRDMPNLLRTIWSSTVSYARC